MKRTKRQTSIEVLNRALAHCDEQIRVLTGWDNALAAETKKLRVSLKNRLSNLLAKEVEDCITQRIIDSVRNKYSLEVPKAKFLIGVSRKGVQVKSGRKLKTVHGFFYADKLDRETYPRILKEAKSFGIEAPYQVYGRFEVLQSPSVNFVNVQDWRSIVRRQLTEVA